MTTPSGDLLRPPSPFMSCVPLAVDRLHEAPRRNKADFGGRQQIIFQATGELAGPQARCQSVHVTTRGFPPCRREEPDVLRVQATSVFRGTSPVRFGQSAIGQEVGTGRGEGYCP